MTIGPDPKAKGGVSSVIAYLSQMFSPFHLVITYQDITSIGKIFLFFKAVLKTVYYCMFKQIRIVHIHTSNYVDFYRNSILLCICKLCRKKVLLHIHGGFFEVFYKAHPRFVAFVCRRADALVTVSSPFVSMLQHYDLNKRIFRLPNGVVLSDNSRKDEPHERLRLLFVGRIDEVKGIYDVLECLHKYKKELQNKVELHIGGGGDEQRFQKMIDDYNLYSMIVWHGWVNGEQKETLYCNSDVFIHPSHFESFGVSILEAMSYGLPVITTMTGGIPDFFNDKECGVAVTAGNVDEVYKAICSFVDNRSCISRIGNYCREKSQQFTLPEVEKQLQSIYVKYL